jgi:hypothetical protein
MAAKRQHKSQHIIGDVLTAEINGSRRSIKYDPGEQ